MKLGRIIGTALLGLLLFVFVAIDLVLFGVVALDSAFVSVLAVMGLVLGAILGAMAARRGGSAGEATVAPEPSVAS